jgi:hypothetical protein
MSVEEGIDAMRKAGEVGYGPPDAVGCQRWLTGRGTKEPMAPRNPLDTLKHNRVLDMHAGRGALFGMAQ